MVMLTFFFLTKNNFLREIWSKKLKLSVRAEIWYLDKLRYAEFIGGVHFFCFRPEKPFSVKFGSKN